MSDKTQKQMIIEMYGMVQRLDERTLKIWKVNEAQEQHLVKINGVIQKNKTRSMINRYSLLGAFAVEGIIITVLLHLMGIY